MPNNKETKRERREMAKKQRMQQQQRAAQQRRKRTIATVLVVALVVAGIAALVATSGSKDKETTKALGSLATTAGCEQVASPANLGQGHVNVGTKLEYNTNPPTSGQHFSQWAPTGIHTAPIPDGNQVHNLEHGHIVIQYQEGKVSEETVKGLTDFVKSNARWSILAPRADMEQPLAFTAWAKISTCASPTSTSDIVAFAKGFYDAYRDKAPESIAGEPQ